MILVCFQGKPFSITVIPNINAKKAEVDWFYEDLQDLLELTPKKDVLFIIGGWNAKAGSQEIPGVTGKFGLGEQNEAGQRLAEFCQENALLLLLLSHFSRVRLCATPEMAAHQAPLSLRFSRQEHWSGLPFPSPRECTSHSKYSFSTIQEMTLHMDITKWSILKSN